VADAGDGVGAVSFERALVQARQRSALPHFIGEAELYCENPDCSIREVVLTIKEHDGPTTTTTLCCPACRRQLKPHHIVTLEEQRDAAERDARISVNVQRYSRRTGSTAIPLGSLLDDSLPGEGA
jgi:hypothetical protein